MSTVPGVTSGAILSVLGGINTVSPLVTVYGDGFLETLENGSAAKPFKQTTLVSSSVTDPNSSVVTSTRVFDLRWGEKAPSYSLPSNDNVSVRLQSSVGIYSFIGAIRGVYPALSVAAPLDFTGPLNISTESRQGVWITSDVKAAWAQGWTGLGIKVGVMDDFTVDNFNDLRTTTLAPTPCGMSSIGGVAVYLCNTSKSVNLRSTHGDQVSSIVGGAKFQDKGFVYETGTWTDGFDVGSYSFGQDLIVSHSTPIYGVAKDAAVYRNDFLTYQSNTNGLFSTLKNYGEGVDPSSQLYRQLKVLNLSLGGTSTNQVLNTATFSSQLAYANSSIVPDIVFIKAAGNSSCVISLTNCDPNNAVFYNSSLYKEKTIIVGALDRDGGVIAGYSNTAGDYASRFLVADGRGVLQTDGSYEQGTSFAAPRVSGYAAIVRQKFPNLDSVAVTSILLDTARYDTLACNPNCNPAVYGRGEASLFRALAPVGRLR